jgi:hypothetical protein
MPRFDVDSYRAVFMGGARQYLFYFKPNFPGSIAGTNIERATFLVRTASLPETTSEEIITNWQGFDFPFAGKATYSDWTVTFNVDTNADVLQMFHNWHSLIHDPTSNIYSAPANYMADQQLELLGLDGLATAKYKIIGAWPKSIGQASLDYSANDVVQFDVSFRYVYHVVDKATYARQATFG